MKLLHILKSEPDDRTKALMNIISEDEEVSLFRLYEEGVDFERLLDLLFEYDKCISWW
jgi:hypothetical protein